MEGDVGLVLTLAISDERRRDRPFNVYKRLDVADESFRRRSLGQSRHAKIANLDVEPAPAEVRSDDRPDLRSEDEKDVETEARYMRWQGYLMQLSTPDREAIKSALWRRGALVRSNALTLLGKEFVGALQTLHDVSQKQDSS